MEVLYEGPVSREQYKGIHDLVNDQGRFQTRCERISTAKRKDGLTSFRILGVLEAKIFQNGFLEEIRCAQITVIDPQHREMKSQLWQLNQNFWLPRKKCLLCCELLVHWRPYLSQF